jgi:hypothetical protein
MNQRGRKSAAALAVVDEGPGLQPIMPPKDLTPAERGVWLEIVNNKPADWFGTEHGPMLVELVRHVCRGSVIDQQIRLFDPEWLKTDEGLRRYDRLVSMGAKVAGVVQTYMRSMRLTHQAIYHKDKASMGPGKGRKLWDRES